MINFQWLELPMSRTIFNGPGVRIAWFYHIKKIKKTLSGADPQGFQRGGPIQSYYRTYLRIWTDTPEQTVWA